MQTKFYGIVIPEQQQPRCPKCGGEMTLNHFGEYIWECKTRGCYGAADVSAAHLAKLPVMEPAEED